MSKTEGFLIDHNPLEVSKTKTVTLQIEGKRVGYLHLDKAVKEQKRLLKLSKSVSEIIIKQEYYSQSLSSDEKKLDSIYYDFLNDGPIKTSELRNYLKTFKIDPTKDRLAIFIEVTPQKTKVGTEDLFTDSEQRIKKIKKSIQDVLTTFYTRFSQNIILYLGGNNFVILKDMGLNPKNYQEEFKKSIRSFYYDLKQELRRDISIGIGNFKPGLTGQKESYEEARTALVFGKQVWGDRNIYHFDNFGVVAPLFTGANQENITFSQNIVKEIKKHKVLSETLQSYLECDLSLNKTAVALKIHRNTLVYRLTRIAKITSLDPRIFNDAFQLKIALLLERYNG